MTLRNEIFEGLAAAQAAKKLLYDPQEWYAEEMYKAARRKNKLNEELDTARKKAQAAGPPTPINQYGGVPAPTTASTTTAIDTTASPTPTQVAQEGEPFRYNSDGMPLPAQDLFGNSILRRGTYRQGGRVQRFQEGGMSYIDPNDPANLPPAERLRRLGRPQQSPMPPPDPDVIVNEMTNRALGAGGSRQAGYGDAPTPVEQTGALNTKSWGQRKAEELGPKFRESMAVPQTDVVTKMVGEEDPNSPRIPKGSKVDRAAQGALDVATAPFTLAGRGAELIAPAIAPPADARERYQQQQERIRLQNAGPGIFATPEEERAGDKARKEGLDKLGEKERALAPVKPGEQPVRPDFKPGEGSQVPTLADVIQQGMPKMTFPELGPNGPNTTGKNTPGGSPGASTATPPKGSAPANTPTNVKKPNDASDTLNVPAPGVTGSAPATPAAPASKPAPATPMAPGPGGRQVPKGSLEDQTRIGAYDPRADAADPNNRKFVDFDGRDIHQVIGGAMQYGNANGPPTVLGEGATSRQTLQTYIQAHDPKAKFSPGEALLAGMISDYRVLLSQGRIEEANRMAYGLIQAATLEAASFGKSAMEMMRQGNYQTAAQQFIRGVNYFPDGMTHRLGPDGTTVITTNNKGEVTARTQITPQILVAAVSGLANGSMFWDSLQKAAATVGQDKNSKLRGLNEELRVQQIEGAKLRNDLLRNPRLKATRQPKTVSDTAAAIYGRDVPKDTGGSGNSSDGAPDRPDFSHIDTPIEAIPD